MEHKLSDVEALLLLALLSGERSAEEVAADHIEHVARVAGIDHVGLGSDFACGSLVMPADLKDVAQFPNLTVELRRRGWSDEALRKVLGENILRVLAEVETHASP
jgi:membrane dipeptidase